jgi:hypothetical protein
MIDTCRPRYAEDVNVQDKLDLDGDEYCDNDKAIYDYATVINRTDYYSQGKSWVSLITSQGVFEVPAGHKLKVKVS